jgi:hypothetical protein
MVLHRQGANCLPCISAFENIPFRAFAVELEQINVANARHYGRERLKPDSPRRGNVCNGMQRIA